MKYKYKGMGPLRLGVKGESIVVRYNDVVEFGVDDNFPKNMFEEVKQTIPKITTKKIKIEEEIKDEEM